MMETTAEVISDNISLSSEEEEEIEIDDGTKKKRGRKPKVKDETTEDKKPKKRGRKPKEKVYSVKELPKTFFEENKNETLILHLPIKATDKNDVTNPDAFNTTNNYFTLNNPVMLATQDNLIEDDNKKNSTTDGAINLYFDNDVTESVKEKDEEEKYEEERVDEENESYVPGYTSSIDNKYDDECRSNRLLKKNLKNIMYEFINANSDKKWPDSTNIYCWWCCHQFSDIPCCMPEYYKKDKFYVSGCFCSFNCCASYNFSKNDDAMWERYSLLNLMYKKLYNKNFVKINLAPPRETLKIFGGFLSIDEFREYSIRNDKTFNVIKPPLVAIIPKIEENIYSKGNKTLYQNTNESILTKTQNNLKLKRNKPITNPNSTLQSFMDFKII